MADSVEKRLRGGLSDFGNELFYQATKMSAGDVIPTFKQILKTL